MRMHQDIVAVNFAELLKLEEQTKDLLRELLNVVSEVKVTFTWQTSEMVVVSYKSNPYYCHGQYHFISPKGSSAQEWAKLLFCRLESHILSGSRFEISEPPDYFAIEYAEEKPTFLPLKLRRLA